MRYSKIDRYQGPRGDTARIYAATELGNRGKLACFRLFSVLQAAEALLRLLGRDKVGENATGCHRTACGWPSRPLWELSELRGSFGAVPTSRPEPEEPTGVVS